MNEELRIREDWVECSLGEVFEIVSGSTPKGLKKVSGLGEIPFYKVSDMNHKGNEVFMKTSNIYLTVADFKNLKLKFYPKGTVIFPKRGGAILTNKKRVLFQKSCFDLNLMGVLPNKFISNNYLFFWFQKLDLRKIYDGSNVPQINKKNILPLNFPITSLSEQKAIVKKLEALFSSLDSGISDLKKAQAQLKVYRQAVLKKAFEGELTNTSKAIKTVSLGSIIEKPRYGSSKKCTLEIKGKAVLRIPNIGNGIINTTELKYADFDKKEVSTLALKEGDILTIRSNGSVGLVGKVALIRKKDLDFLYAGYLIRLRPNKEEVDSKYLLHCLSSHSLRVQIESKAKSTSGVNNINSGELASLLIPLCSIEEQHKIVKEIETRLSVCDQVEKDIANSLKKAKALRQSILKKAFEGKLLSEAELAECKADAAYEPASVLLEKIKAEKKQK